MKRNPHPARRTRIATLAISASAFVSVISGLVWNTQQAEFVSNVTDANAVAVAVEQATSPPSTTTSAVPAAGVTTPAATIAPTAQAAPAVPAVPAAPAKKNSATLSPKKNVTSAPTIAAVPATPATPAAPATPAVATAAPVAAPAIYTCMSPGGKTQNPTGSGSCKNAKYGYVLTQI